MRDFGCLVGLGVDEAQSQLVEQGVEFIVYYYYTAKQTQWDKELIVAVREGNPIELVVGRFKFSCGGSL